MLRDDLVQSLQVMLTRSERIDHVIVEASGVADPAGLTMTFLDRRDSRLMRLDSVSCLVDAEGVFAHADDAGLTALKLRQIGFADLVVRNKADLVTPAHVEVIRDWIGLHLNRVRVVEAAHADVPLEVLLGAASTPIDSAAPPAACSIPVPRTSGGGRTARRPPCRPRRSPRWSSVTCPGRCTAARASCAPPRRPVFAMCCRSSAGGTGWSRSGPGFTGHRSPITEIVAIGRGMDADELTKLFDGCLAHTP